MRCSFAVRLSTFLGGRGATAVQTYLHLLAVAVCGLVSKVTRLPGQLCRWQLKLTETCPHILAGGSASCRWLLVQGSVFFRQRAADRVAKLARQMACGPSFPSRSICRTSLEGVPFNNSPTVSGSSVVCTCFR